MSGVIVKNDGLLGLKVFDRTYRLIFMRTDLHDEAASLVGTAAYVKGPVSDGANTITVSEIKPKPFLE